MYLEPQVAFYDNWLRVPFFSLLTVNVDKETATTTPADFLRRDKQQTRCDHL
jgi:hypothetical protein